MAPGRSLAWPQLQRRLLAWFDAERRALPWRDREDPYAVWVSEIMLQQTRVETVLPYYERWLERFPSVSSLAAAGEEEVLAAWSGLGYYSRARNLHRAAREVVALHEGSLPRDPAALAALPGIGRYTAGAIASIAYGIPVPAVDGNAVRVIARLRGERRSMAQAAVRHQVEEHAAAILARDRPGDWNQAVMELGAQICTPRAPRCAACPVAAGCVAHAEGTAHEIPVLPAKRIPVPEPMHFALIEQEGRFLFVRRPAEGLLAGTLSLPGGSASLPLPRLVAAQTGLRVRKGRLLGSAEHRFTHRHWSMRIFSCSFTPGTLHADARWLEPQALGVAPVSAAVRKALAAAGV